MNQAFHDSDSDSEFRSSQDSSDREPSDKRFKKLKRPSHAAKRSGVPERLSGMHRRRRKRMDW